MFFRVVGLWFCVGVVPAIGQSLFERPPIAYSATTPQDRVARRLGDASPSQLQWRADPKFGYLLPLLDALEIPVSSQTLVFSRTSLQRSRISPENPRAIYFNSDTYVGWVPGGEVIEVASVDPQLGTVFYTIEQPSEPTGPTAMDGRIQGQPAVQRRTDRCLFCHASSDSGRVPGLLMQSVFTNETGNRVFPADVPAADPAGPLTGRWGGWFVTGSHGNQVHLGNLTLASQTRMSEVDLTKTGNWLDLSIRLNTSKYPSPHSDLVALLVLQHQVEMHNLLTRANHTVRLKQYEVSAANQAERKTSLPADQLAKRQQQREQELKQIIRQVAEEIVNACLMVDAIPFSAPVAGTSSFAQEFAKQGVDGLKQLDLKQKLFRLPCSYLIDTSAVARLPASLHETVKQQLSNILRMKNSDPRYGHLSESDRLEILKILRARKVLP